MRFRNKMAYDLIKGIPQMMGLRTQFVHLYVKDNTDGSSDAFQDYGLYTQVEQLNKTALKTHGLDSKGQLYKVNDGGIGLQPWFDITRGKFKNESDSRRK